METIKEVEARYRKQYSNYDEVQKHYSTMKESEKCMFHNKYHGMLCQYGSSTHLFKDTAGKTFKMCDKHADKLSEIRVNHY